MSKIEQLIQQLCPEGVEYKRLGEVCTTLIPKIKIKAHDYLESGQYPIIDQGQEFIGGYTNEEGVFPKGKYVLFGDHTCTVKYVDFPFAQGADGLKVIVAHEKNLIPKFLYYCMCNIHIQADYARHWGKMKENEIPLPPLAVQEEIVRILDAFTQLEAELEAELEARKKQYAYYRDTLLSFEHDDPEVEWKKLGEVCEMPKQRTKIADVSCYVGVENLLKDRGGVNKDFERNSTEQAIHFLPNDILIANIRPYLKKIWQADCTGGTNGDVILLRPMQDVDNRYIYFFLSSDKFLDFLDSTSKGGKMPRGDKKRIPNVLIPLPPLPVQQEIVRILDKFEALTSDLQSGLPAEIEARKKQYEYYRDRLLTFKVKN